MDPPRVSSEGRGETLAVDAEAVDRLEGSAAACEVPLEYDLTWRGESLTENWVAAFCRIDGSADAHNLFAVIYAR